MVRCSVSIYSFNTRYSLPSLYWCVSVERVPYSLSISYSNSVIICRREEGSSDSPSASRMTTWLCLAVVWCTVSLTRGALECDCTTEECMSQGLTTCFASKFCYAEYFRETLTRGCIDKGTPLLCENWRPKKLNTPWPSMFCCNDADHCNRNVKPTDPIDSVEETTTLSSIDHPADSKKSDCADSKTNKLLPASTGGNKLMNPIYIAVPVAGVCVLLALIIFAMYLLRRRNDYYHHYHYQDHPPHLAQNSCEAKKAVSGCGSVNRCTDSERSSSGSETKLFLQV